MRTIEEIHAEIDRASDRRAELWRTLNEGRDPAVVEELNALTAKIDQLWAEQRQVRATLRFGDRSRIVARARAEERLERAA
jgi:hypothetical protein